MKSMLQSILLSIKLKLFTFYIKWLLKVRTMVRTVLFQKLYLNACEMFPSEKLARNSDLASSLVQKLLALESLSLDIDKDNRDTLLESIQHDEWINQKIADYHRLTAFYYSYGNSLNLHMDLIEDSMSKAKDSLESSEPLDEDGVKQIYAEVKRERKSLRKRIYASNKLRINRERLESISPVTITATHFSVALTLISTLFLISGFIYTKAFFYWFDVSVGDFYTVQDYLASSIDVISSTAFSAFIGIMSLGLGFNRGLNEELHNGQFDIQEARKDYVWPAILILSALGLIVSIYTTGRWPSVLVYPLVLSLSFFLYFRLPFWDYIENRASVGVVCLMILFFFIHLSLKVKDNIENVLYGDYKPRYTISLEKTYSNYSSMSYLMSNSSYVFLLDEEDGLITVLPKNSVRSFEARN